MNNYFQNGVLKAKKEIQNKLNNTGSGVLFTEKGKYKTETYKGCSIVIYVTQGGNWGADISKNEKFLTSKLASSSNDALSQGKRFIDDMETWK